MNDADILRNVIPIFKSYGVKSITMDDISSKLGISKKTLYVHYKGKDDLVQQCLIEIFKTHHLVFTRVLERNMPPLKKIILLYRYVIRQLSSNSVTFYSEMKKYYPKAFQYYLKEREYITFEIVLKLLEDVQQSGVIIKEVNLNLFCRLNLLKMDMLLLDRDLNSEFTVSEILDHLVIYNLRGILSEKGRIDNYL